MNIFRLLGDISHLLAVIILLRKIWLTRSCAGNNKFIHFSYKTIMICVGAGTRRQRFVINNFNTYHILFYFSVKYFINLLKFISISKHFTVLITLLNINPHNRIFIIGPQFLSYQHCSKIMKTMRSLTFVSYNPDCLSHDLGMFIAPMKD
jgi:hypothetical protein